MMEAADAPEAPVRIYQNALRYMWECGTVSYTQTLTGHIINE